MSVARARSEVDLARVQAQVAQGELDEAIAGLAVADPRDGAATLYLAYLERQRGRYDRSEAVLDRRIALGLDDAETLLQRGYTRWNAGNLAGAASDMGRVANGEGEAGVRARAAAGRSDVESQRREMADVAARAETLDVAWVAGGLALAAIVLLALWRARRP
jgi:tetratricopeptide (TPR) repeat protein